MPVKKSIKNRFHKETAGEYKFQAHAIWATMLQTYAGSFFEPIDSRLFNKIMAFSSMDMPIFDTPDGDIEKKKKNNPNYSPIFRKDPYRKGITNIIGSYYGAGDEQYESDFKLGKECADKIEEHINSLSGEGKNYIPWLKLNSFIFKYPMGVFGDAYMKGMYYSRLMDVVGVGIKRVTKDIKDDKGNVIGKEYDYETLAKGLRQPDGKGFFVPYMAMCQATLDLFEADIYKERQSRIGWTSDSKAKYKEMLMKGQTAFVKSFDDLRNVVLANPGLYNDYTENHPEHLVEYERDHKPDYAYMKGELKALENGWDVEELALLGFVGEMNYYRSVCCDATLQKGIKDATAKIERVSANIKTLEDELQGLKDKNADNKEIAKAESKLENARKDLVREQNKLKNGTRALKDQETLRTMTKELMDKVWDKKINSMADKRYVLNEFKEYLNKTAKLTFNDEANEYGTHIYDKNFKTMIDKIEAGLTTGITGELEFNKTARERLSVINDIYGMKDTKDMPFNDKELAVLAMAGTLSARIEAGMVYRDNVDNIDDTILKESSKWMVDFTLGVKDPKPKLKKFNSIIEKGKSNAVNAANAYKAGDKKAVAHIIYDGLRQEMYNIDEASDMSQASFSYFIMLDSFLDMLSRDDRLMEEFNTYNESRPANERIDIDAVKSCRNIAGICMDAVDKEADFKKLSAWYEGSKKRGGLKERYEHAERNARISLAANELVKTVAELKSKNKNANKAFAYLGTEEGRSEFEDYADMLNDEMGVVSKADNMSLMIGDQKARDNETYRIKFYDFTCKMANKEILRELRSGNLTKEKMAELAAEYVTNNYLITEYKSKLETGYMSDFADPSNEAVLRNKDKARGFANMVKDFAVGMDMSNMTSSEFADILEGSNDALYETARGMEIVIDRTIYNDPEKRAHIKFQYLNDGLSELLEADKRVLNGSKEYDNILKDYEKLSDDVIKEGAKLFRDKYNKYAPDFEETGYIYNARDLVTREKDLIDRLTKYIDRKNKELERTPKNKTIIKRTSAAKKALADLKKRYEQDLKLPSVTEEDLDKSTSYDAYLYFKDDKEHPENKITDRQDTKQMTGLEMIQYEIDEARYQIDKAVDWLNEDNIKHNTEEVYNYKHKLYEGIKSILYCEAVSTMYAPKEGDSPEETAKKDAGIKKTLYNQEKKSIVDIYMNSKFGKKLMDEFIVKATEPSIIMPVGGPFSVKDILKTRDKILKRCFMEEINDLKSIYTKAWTQMVMDGKQKQENSFMARYEKANKDVEKHLNEFKNLFTIATSLGTDVLDGGERIVNELKSNFEAKAKPHVEKIQANRAERKKAKDEANNANANDNVVNAPKKPAL